MSSKLNVLPLPILKILISSSAIKEITKIKRSNSWQRKESSDKSELRDSRVSALYSGSWNTGTLFLSLIWSPPEGDTYHVDTHSLCLRGTFPFLLQNLSYSLIPHTRPQPPVPPSKNVSPTPTVTPISNHHPHQCHFAPGLKSNWNNFLAANYCP